MTWARESPPTHTHTHSLLWLGVSPGSGEEDSSLRGPDCPWESPCTLGDPFPAFSSRSLLFLVPAKLGPFWKLGPLSVVAHAVSSRGHTGRGLWLGAPLTSPCRVMAASDTVRFGGFCLFAFVFKPPHISTVKGRCPQHPAVQQEAALSKQPRGRRRKWSAQEPGQLAAHPDEKLRV